MRLLQENGAELNVFGGGCGHALHAASLEGSEGIVRFLLEKVVDVTARGGRLWKRAAGSYCE